ncbi:hypothetical protein [Streptomyces jumonjinensis]|uniref:hypothetical protein n=1 Tax=Streptomyces jumonjinensis TaxID=1945 RepID=UPI0037AA235C
MLDSILRALVWVLNTIPWTRRAQPGRHTAQYLAARPAPVRVSAWSRPWGGPSAEEARAIFRADEALKLPPVKRERYFAVAFAERGYDYPYVAPGVHQVRTKVPA